MADYTNWIPKCAYRFQEGVSTEVHQGIGPGGISFVFYTLPDADLSVFEDCFRRHGGKYGERVTWLFTQRGQILVSKRISGIDENTLVLEGLGAGADDVRFDDGDLMEIIMKPRKLEQIADVLDLEDIPTVQKGCIWHPQSLIPLEDRDTITEVLSFLDEILRYEKIVNMTADFWISDEIIYGKI